MNIYVGNLAYSATEDTVRSLFEEFGQVLSVKLIKDKFTGNPKGFAFVEMGSEDEASAAIDALNGKDFEGRKLKVNKALPRESNGGGNRDSRESRPQRPRSNRF